MRMMIGCRVSRACVPMGELISRSTTEVAPTYVNERARIGGKNSWEWEMSVGLGSIMVELAKIHLLDLLSSCSG